MAGFAEIFNMLNSKESINIDVGHSYKYTDENSGSVSVRHVPFVSNIKAEGTSYADEIKEQEEEDWKVIE